MSDYETPDTDLDNYTSGTTDEGGYDDEDHDLDSDDD